MSFLPFFFLETWLYLSFPVFTFSKDRGTEKHFSIIRKRATYWDRWQPKFTSELGQRPEYSDLCHPGT